MTNKNSSLREIKAQADAIAKTLKAAERGELVDPKIEAARKTPNFIVGVVMDDKVLRITLPWETIRSFGEVALSEWIIREMRETKGNN
jgi:hypothetical protein